MNLKLRGNIIRATIIPPAEKYENTILYCPPVSQRNYARTGVEYEPVRAKVTDVGPLVKYVNIGDVVVLSNHNYTLLNDKDDIIFGEYLDNKYYWTDSGKEIDRYRDKARLDKAQDTDIMSGSIVYVETNDDICEYNDN